MKKLVLVLVALTSILMSCSMPNTPDMTQMLPIEKEEVKYPEINALEVRSLYIGDSTEVRFDSSHIYFIYEGRVKEVLDIDKEKSDKDHIASTVNSQANIYWVLFYTDTMPYDGKCVLISSVYYPGHNEYLDDGTVLKDTLDVEDYISLENIVMK